MRLLEKQVAIVTGAGQGLGKTIALEFAQEGAAVALLEINAETVKAVEAEIRANGGEAKAYPLDITDYDAYAAVVADLLSWKGKIDVLVNNAGIALYGTILEDDLESWRQVVAVNLEAVYMGSKLVAPHMVEKRAGRIIMISSIAGFASRGRVGSYNATKGAVIAFTKSMAVELGQYNILVNAIAPGFLITPMLEEDGLTASEEFQDWYIGRGKIPLRRGGYPEDVAGTAVFLASSYCRYMTGQVLVVDGGLTSTF
jgi:3-oxoacyl-[acyl-carrier protein] reductase